MIWIHDDRWRDALTNAQADEQVAFSIKRGEVTSHELSDHLTSRRDEIVKTIDEPLSAELQCEEAEIDVKKRWDTANRALANWMYKSEKPRMIAAFLMSNPGPTLSPTMSQEDIEVTLGLARLTRALTYLPIQLREPLPATEARRTQNLLYVSTATAIVSLLICLFSILVVWLRDGWRVVSTSLATPWTVVSTSAAIFGVAFLVTTACAVRLLLVQRPQRKAMEEVRSLIFQQARVLGKDDLQDLDQELKAARTACKTAVRHSNAALVEKLQAELRAYIAQKPDFVQPEMAASYDSAASLAPENLRSVLNEPDVESVRGKLLAVAIPSQQQGALDEVSVPLTTNMLRVFLCHASQDKPRIRELYQKLTVDGFDVWLDEESLLPGQDWQEEIPRAVKASHVVLVCLSRAAITKVGYLQREIRFALDVADEQPEGSIFLIPLKLEDCDLPTRLSRWQWVNLHIDGGYTKLLRSLRRRANEVGLTAVT